MKRSFWIILFCAFFGTEVLAQKQTRNNIYGEAMGFAGHYSINYERFQPFLQHRLVLCGLNAGFSLLQYDLSRGYAIPFGLKVCIGAKNIYGEFGGDFLLVHEGAPDFSHGGWRKDPSYSTFQFLHFGIRYQPEKKGLFLRLFLFPIKVVAENGLLLYYTAKPSSNTLIEQGKKHVWWGGLNIGYTF